MAALDGSIVLAMEAIAKSVDTYLQGIESALGHFFLDPAQVLAEVGKIVTLSIAPTLVFWLTQRAARNREKVKEEREAREKKKKAQAIRKMVYLEIDHNRTVLHTFYLHLSERVAYGKTVYSYIRMLTLLDFPSFQKTVFKGQLQTLPDLLVDQEILDVFRFYNHLDSLAVKYSGLSSKEEFIVSRDSNDRKTRFKDFIAQDVEPFQNLLKETWDGGNPLVTLMT